MLYHKVSAGATVTWGSTELDIQDGRLVRVAVGAGCPLGLRWDWWASPPGVTEAEAAWEPQAGRFGLGSCIFTLFTLTTLILTCYMGRRLSPQGREEEGVRKVTVGKLCVKQEAVGTVALLCLQVSQDGR